MKKKNGGEKGNQIFLLPAPFVFSEVDMKLTDEQIKSMRVDEKIKRLPEEQVSDKWDDRAEPCKSCDYAHFDGQFYDWICVHKYCEHIGERL